MCSISISVHFLEIKKYIRIVVLAGTSTDNLSFFLDSKPGWIKVILAHLLGTGKEGDGEDIGLWTPVTYTLAPALPQFFSKFCNFPGLSFFNDKIREMNKIISFFLILFYF